jgi:SAM-dependent methyltransferase
MSDLHAATNILGEVLWHTANKDDSILQVSHNHTYEVLDYARRYLPARADLQRPRFLEVAAYAHITGYLLAQRHGWDATLSDISVDTLALGATRAQQFGLDAARVRRVAVDFHDLPFADGAFDIVYICSALHHTLRWQVALRQLLRVTAPGGLLILSNEPCHREFCFYKFPANRPAAFRPVESELDRLGILRTVAEPFLGSRPETLYGMVENQKMPLPEILQLLRGQGTIEFLSVDSQPNMSSLDRALLAARSGPGGLEALSGTMEQELTTRLGEARRKLTATDEALGIRFPEAAEVSELAARVARKVAALPLPAAAAPGAATPIVRPTVGAMAKGMLRRIAYAVYRAPVLGSLAARALKMAAGAAHRIPAIDVLLARGLRRLWTSQAPAANDYDIALAGIFGGAFSAVVRKEAAGAHAANAAELRYCAGSRKGVTLGYPPALASMLELASDLVPDLQGAAREEIERHFPAGEWKLGSDGEVRDLALRGSSGSIRLRPAGLSGKCVALLRLNGAPVDGPYRIRLLAEGVEIAGVDVYQADSFLLRGELQAIDAVSVLQVDVRALGESASSSIAPVRVLALRIVCVAGN